MVEMTEYKLAVIVWLIAFYIWLSLFAFPEMDATRYTEYQIFPGVSILSDTVGQIVFLFAHIPLFFGNWTKNKILICLLPDPCFCTRLALHRKLEKTLTKCSVSSFGLTWKESEVDSFLCKSSVFPEHGTSLIGPCGKQNLTKNHDLSHSREKTLFKF